MKRVITLALMLLLFGCSSDTSQKEIKLVDTGTSEEVSTDSGSEDSGSTDSGSKDSESKDTGSEDSGSNDSGSQNEDTGTSEDYKPDFNVSVDVHKKEVNVSTDRPKSPDFKTFPDLCKKNEDKCDGVDNDCDGEIDEKLKNIYYKDKDGDGYTKPGPNKRCSKPSEDWVEGKGKGLDLCRYNEKLWSKKCGSGCKDKDGDGYYTQGCDANVKLDCDDNDASKNSKETFYKDKDGDGFGSKEVKSCTKKMGLVSMSKGEDCNDNRNDVYPGALEKCDGRDNDCDDQIDEDLAKRDYYKYEDKDNDGYKVLKSKQKACSKPIGYSSNQLSKPDCDDGHSQYHPGAPETCDGKDNDCDEQTDENITRSCGTSTGQCRKGTQTCTNGQWGNCMGKRGPQPETCDGKDNDCNGKVDDLPSNVNGDLKIKSWSDNVPSNVCKVKGDLVIDLKRKTNKKDFLDSLKSVRVVEGDFKMTRVDDFHLSPAFDGLKKVEGDFLLEGGSSSYHKFRTVSMDFSNLKNVCGNMRIDHVELPSASVRQSYLPTFTSLECVGDKACNLVSKNSCPKDNNQDGNLKLVDIKNNKINNPKLDGFFNLKKIEGDLVIDDVDYKELKAFGGMKPSDVMGSVYIKDTFDDGCTSSICNSP